MRTSNASNLRGVMKQSDTNVALDLYDSDINTWVIAMKHM